MMKQSLIRVLSLCVAALLSTNAAQADWTISFSNTDFGITPVFNDVQDWEFEIVMAGDLATGVYTNSDIVSVDYTIFGLLPDATPSGFPGFFLERVITGPQFIGQGSSMLFEIAAGADLSDGLQFNELTGTDPMFGSTFLFDAREVGNGRYHPPIVTLNADGTGIIQNSNNFGGINPGTGNMVDVDYGDEYITDVTFDPSTFTLSPVPVPEPGSLSIVALSLGLFATRRRRR